MKLTQLIFASVVLLLVLTLTGCVGQAPETASPTAAAYAYPPPMNDPDEVAASLTAIPDEGETAAPTEEPQDPDPTAVVVEEPEVDNCVTCHTDQQTLIDTSDPVAEVESENEGEG